MRNDSSGQSTQAKETRFLKAAEYTALGASAVGALVTAVTQQAVYAVAPLSVSLFLNLANRQRLQKEADQQIKGAIAQVDQRILQLHRSLLTLQRQLTTEINQQATLLESPAEEQPEITAGLPTEQVESQLKQLSQTFSEELQSLRQALQALPSSPDLVSFQALEQAVTGLQERLGAIESLQLAERLLELQSSLLTDESGRVDLEEKNRQLENELAQLSQKLSEGIQSLQEQFQATQPKLQNLQEPPPESELQALQQVVSDLRNRLATIEREFPALIKQIPARPDSASFQALEQTIAGLQRRLNTIEALKLAKRLNEFQSLQAAASARSSLENKIQSVESRLSQLSQKLFDDIQTLQEHLQKPEPELVAFQALQEAISELKNRLAALESEFWELVDRLPNSSPSVETLEKYDPPEQSSTLIDEATTSAWADNFKPEDDDLEILELNLGIDFGTSFTKVCFRDTGRERSEVVTFSDDRSNLEEALLPTKVGILADGRLVAGLTASEWKDYEPKIQKGIEFIKMRLADLDLPHETEGWRLEELPELDDPEMVENLCAYYLWQVIVKTQVWIRNQKSDLLYKQKVQWLANVGVPVAYCDSDSLKRFERVLALAWLLSNEPHTEMMTIQTLGDRMKRLRQQLKGDVEIDCHAVPEIAAEVWSFINSRQVDEGFYVFFDVGDGTLDAGSFRFWNHAGERKVDFFLGKVEPLGVSAASRLVSTESGLSIDQAKQKIVKGSHYLQVLTGTKNKIQKLVGSVVVQSSDKYKQYSLTLREDDFQRGLKTFICGGGSEIAFYRETILATHSDFQQDRAGIPKYEIQHIPNPKDLSLNGLSGRDFHRFAVAYGLSIPKGELPEIRLPREVDQSKPKRFDSRDSIQDSRYEDMRGSY